ncbi:MAG: hypothetical protein WD737_11120 [Gemmatimonadota bacterium]
MEQTASHFAPPAHLSLRAHRSAPARVELVYRPASRRLFRTCLWLLVTWGMTPILLWIPPHYPWITLAVVAGALLSYREWTGRYWVQSFAGVCPRCGAPLALGLDRMIDLPHVLTCFTCHFEPRLEVQLAGQDERHFPDEPEHQEEDCVGHWRTRWLADAAFLYCDECHAGVLASPQATQLAEAENERAEILRRLTDEGQPLI